MSLPLLLLLEFDASGYAPPSRDCDEYLSMSSGRQGAGGVGPHQSTSESLVETKLKTKRIFRTLVG